MTTKREEAINELAYVVGKERAETLILGAIEEALSPEGDAFEAFKEWLKRTDIGHVPTTWFLLAQLLSDRDHRIAEKIRKRADDRDRILGRVLPTELSVAERNVADFVDPKVAS